MARHLDSLYEVEEFEQSIRGSSTWKTQENQPELLEFKFIIVPEVPRTTESAYI